MTHAVWLVSLLCPRAVSPHPNFASVDLITAPGLLGLVIQGRFQEFNDLLGQDKVELTENERVILTAAPRVFATSTTVDAAEVLASMALEEDAEPGVAVAAALLATLGFSEMEFIDEVNRLLSASFSMLAAHFHDQRFSAVQFEAEQISETYRELTRDESILLAAGVLGIDEAHDFLLLAAAIKQQQAMRQAEFEIENVATLKAARLLIEAIDPRQVSRFPRSRGAKWGPVETVRNVRDLLLEANEDLEGRFAGFPDPKALQQILRRKQSPLATLYLQGANSGMVAFAGEKFSEFTMNDERVLRNNDPVDDPVWRSLTVSELAGHRGHAQRHRLILGQLRLVRGGKGRVSSIHLLRQSGDIKSVNLALTFLRGEGPLSALEAETRRVVQRRLAPELLRDVELAVIAGGAQTLDRSTAKEALSGIMAAGLNLDVVPRLRFQLASVRVEQLVRTIVALAPVAEENEKVSDWLLNALQSVGPTSDELLVRAYGRGVAAIEWSGLDAVRIAEWVRWATDSALTAGWQLVVDQLSPFLRQVPGADETAEMGSVSVLNLANELNAVMAGSSAPTWLLSRAVPIVIGDLARGRAEAVSRLRSYSSTNTADIAVGLGLHLGADIWTPLIEYLTDISVPRLFKVDAIDRMAASPHSVPGFAVSRLRDAAESLLAPSRFSSVFDPVEIDPFPALIRFLGATKAWPSQSIALAVARLAAGDERARVEAGRTVVTLMDSTLPIPEWVIFAAVQLSADQNANVRAESGRALAIGSGRSKFGADLLAERLEQLLGEDGILVPLLALRGLSAVRSELSDRVMEQVSDLAENHLVHGVREQARYLVNARVS